MEIRYPHIEVRLTGTNGNAFAIIGKVKQALRDNGVPKEMINQFIDEATAGDYDNVLQTCMKWVDVS
jgi:hypothetical protein